MAIGEPLPRLFISCVSPEFATVEGPFSRTRQKLAQFLRRAECEVAVQEDFGQSDVATLEKLDEYIRNCDAVVHIVGELPGSKAAPQAVERLLAKMEAEGRPFLCDQPEALRDRLGDFSDLTYTQWEAFLALHHKRSLYVYCSVESRTEQKEHCTRLYQANPSRHGEDFTDREDLIGKVLADLAKIFPSISPERKPNNLPGSIGELFKGRGEFIDKIRDTLASSVGAITQTIAGLGGIGKTRLAIEFGHANEQSYDALFFLSADTPEALKRNIADLTGPLVLDLPEYEGDLDTRLAAALRWLESHTNWFLIIDNVDHEEAACEVEAMLARLKNGHVLVTSRLAKWSNQVKKLDLELLDESAAKEFLLERTDPSRSTTPTDDADLETLVTQLDGLALGLEQAGAYISEREISFAEYLRRFAEQKAKVLEWHDERIMQYPASIAVTWQTSFEQLNDDARDLLNQLSFMAPEPIPRALVEDEEDALITLRKLSLVRFVEEPPNSFVVHRLVQEIVRGRLAEEEAKGAFEQLVSALAKWVPNFGQDISTWDQWSEFEPHSETVFDHAAALGDSTESSYLLNGFAGFQHFRNGAYGQAELLYRRALEADENNLGPEHPDTLTSLNNLALLLDDKGDYNGAEPLYRRALEARERILGPEHPNTLSSLNNLAGLLESKGAYDEAEPLIRCALEARERILGPEHPNTLNSLNNLAALLDSKGKYDEVEPLYRRALEARERILGPEHPNTLTSLNNLAAFHFGKGEYEEAVALFRRAYTTSLAKLGTEHPDTILRKGNLEAAEAALNGDD